MTGNHVSLNLKFIRELHGLTQESIARQLHMSRASYIALESGDRTATADDLHRIAYFARVSMEDLMTGNLRQQLQSELLTASHATTPDLFIAAYSRLSEAGRILVADQIDRMLAGQQEQRCYHE